MDLQYCGKTVNCLYYKGCPVSSVYYKGQLVYQKKYYTVCVLNSAYSAIGFGDTYNNGTGYCCWNSEAYNNLKIRLGGNACNISVNVKVYGCINSIAASTYSFTENGSCYNTNSSSVQIRSLNNTSLLMEHNYICNSGNLINLDIACINNNRYCSSYTNTQNIEFWCNDCLKLCACTIGNYNCGCTYGCLYFSSNTKCTVPHCCFKAGCIRALLCSSPKICITTTVDNCSNIITFNCKCLTCCAANTNSFLYNGCFGTCNFDVDYAETLCCTYNL